MTALKKELHLAKDINLVYDLTEKPNRSNLSAHEDRAVIAKLKADLVLPNDKIMTVDIDFDTDSGYHRNAILVMDEFGVEMIATAFEAKYGKSHAERVRKAWAEKRKQDDPRKPTYLLIQKPEDDQKVPSLFAPCGGEKHPPKDSSETIVK